MFTHLHLTSIQLLRCGVQQAIVPRVTRTCHIGSHINRRVNTLNKNFHRMPSPLQFVQSFCTSPNLTTTMRSALWRGFGKSSRQLPPHHMLRSYGTVGRVGRVCIPTTRSATLLTPAFRTSHIALRGCGIPRVSGRVTAIGSGCSGSHRGMAMIAGRYVTDTHVIGALIGANVLVWGAWHVVNGRTMMRHFTLSNYGLSHGRFHTLVTSMFSHVGFMHLAFNMFTLFFFARNTMQVIGQRNFLRLYMVGGLASGLCFVAFNKLLPRLNIPAHFHRNPNRVALGASGAVNAIVMFSVCVFPRATLLLYGIVPVPAAVFGVGYVAYDLYGAWMGTSGTAHTGHLGGALVGVLYWLMLRRRLVRF